MKKIISAAALAIIFSSQVYACGDEDDADTIILGGGAEETDVFIDGRPARGFTRIAYGDDEDADVIIEGFPVQGFALGDDEDDADIIIDGGGAVESAQPDLAVSLLVKQSTDGGFEDFDDWLIRGGS